MTVTHSRKEGVSDCSVHAPWGRFQVPIGTGGTTQTPASGPFSGPLEVIQGLPRAMDWDCTVISTHGWDQPLLLSLWLPRRASHLPLHALELHSVSWDCSGLIRLSCHLGTDYQNDPGFLPVWWESVPRLVTGPHWVLCALRILVPVQREG